MIVTSGGSQTGLSRWGDYAAMRIDPSDDCTFWFTSEYIPSNGSFNWHTRIASFKFNSCGAAPVQDFTLSATPASRTVVQGGAASYTASVGVVNGFGGAVGLTVTGLPSGATPTFIPLSVSGGGDSSLNVSTTGGTPPGTYTLTITGTSGSLVHSTTVTLVVQAAAPPDFSLSASPPSQTIAARQSAAYTISVVNKVNGFNGTVTFSVTGLLPRTSATFSPSSSTTGTTLTVKANPSAKAGTTTLVITGTSGGLAHTVNVTFAIK